ncbi:hypothetical protein AOLI_G00097490 [Acnodon oligacanthus]
MCLCSSLHKPSTCLHPRDWTKTADWGADGLEKSSAGEGRVSGSGLEETIVVDKRRKQQAECVMTADNPMDNKGIVADCMLGTWEAGRIWGGVGVSAGLYTIT